MKHIVLLFTALLLVLTGCKKEPNGLSESERNASLVFDKADIMGAEYLTVIQTTATKSKSTTDDRNVLKIDKDGNMTAVVFYMTYTKDPNSGNLVADKELRTDVKVIPDQIVRFGGVYTYLARCSFIDDKGQHIFPSAYSIGGLTAMSPSFLIRNSDGAVFYSGGAVMLLDRVLPSTYERDPNDRLNTVSFDKNNDMYFSTSSSTHPKDIIYKLTLQGERDLSIKEVTPANMGSRSFVLSNTPGVLVAGEIKDGIYSNGSNFAFYPSGGFEQINTDNTLCAAGNNFKFFKQEGSYDEQTGQYTSKTTIKAVNVSAQPPLTNNIEAEVSITYAKFQSVPNFTPTYSVDCKNHYIIGGQLEDNKSQLFVVDKSSKNVQVVTLDKFPERKNTYATDYPDRIGNTIFSIDGTTKTIKSYDFETLQYREVQYNDSELGGFFEKGTSFRNTPPAYIKYGTRGLDGKPVTVEINIETGAVKVTVDPDDRKTIILVRIA